ncbi:NAD(P)-binding protein [Exidia glandulosa HHB12029]|uniref:NAD(P)-binding protein n=1 Tax=Exidia glandulosa HHB12029 TaxID=1314781 RepID=A0A165IHJ2_EXIGL|nr:NAD(P)-binding protein [Exidia glandulosa HHB12029]
MVDCSDADLFSHASRAAGKVVLITGGANGIGRQASLDFARHGAKVVIGDLETDAAAKVVDEITTAGGEAVFLKCDVTNWDDQHALFQLAVRTYGSVDIVVPNAGITEGGAITRSIAGSQPTKPNLKALEVNLIGVFYTTQLALFHFGWRKHQWNKALVFVGSMASTVGIPLGYEYSASKHALVGLMGSLHAQCLENEIRLGLVAPWFTDTAILDAGIRFMLAGIPYASIKRVSGAIFAAATNDDPATHAAIWAIPDDKEVCRVNREVLDKGPYKVLMTRVERLMSTAGLISRIFRTLGDLFDLFGTKMLVFAVAIAFGAALYKGAFVAET